MTGLMLKDMYSLRTYFLKQLALMTVLYLAISVGLDVYKRQGSRRPTHSPDRRGRTSRWRRAPAQWLSLIHISGMEALCMAQWISACLFALSANIDNFPIGIAYGLRGMRIGAGGNLLIACLTSLGTAAAMLLGGRCV